MEEGFQPSRPDPEACALTLAFLLVYPWGAVVPMSTHSEVWDSCWTLDRGGHFHFLFPGLDLFCVFVTDCFYNEQIRILCSGRNRKHDFSRWHIICSLQRAEHSST